MFDGGGFMSQTSPAEEKKPRQGIVPVTIKMVVDATSDEDTYVIDGREVSQVRLVANILRADNRETKMTYTVEDGTGAIEITLWNHEDHKVIETGTYVNCVAQLKKYNQKPQLNAYDIRPISCGEEITHHLLETIYVHGKPAPVAAPVAEAMDTDLNSLQKQVLDYYTQYGTSDEGLHINKVLEVFGKDAKVAIDCLTSEGYLYSTLDDDHHKSTDCD